MNISDWKTIQTRNDIKYIKRKIEGNNVANWSIAVDVFLVLLGFVFDNILGGQQAVVDWIWGTIGILGTFIPIGLLVFQAINNRSKEQKEHHVANVRILVPLFDDEICYSIMSAETFYGSLVKDSVAINSKQEALMQEFLYIETSYYLSKTIGLLQRMDGNLDEVLNEKPGNNYISKNRMLNVINLIDLLCNCLIDYSSRQKDTLKKFGITLDKDKVGKQHSELVKFVAANRILGITLNALDEDTVK